MRVRRVFAHYRGPFHNEYASVRRAVFDPAALCPPPNPRHYRQTCGPRTPSGSFPEKQIDSKDADGLQSISVFQLLSR